MHNFLHSIGKANEAALKPMEKSEIKPNTMEKSAKAAEEFSKFIQLFIMNATQFTHTGELKKTFNLTSRWAKCVGVCAASSKPAAIAQKRQNPENKIIKMKQQTEKVTSQIAKIRKQKMPTVYNRNGACSYQFPVFSAFRVLFVSTIARAIYGMVLMQHNTKNIRW